MGLSYKDAVSTMLVGIVIGIWYALNTGMKLPIISNYRMGILALLLIGFGMCAFTTTIKEGEMTSNPMVILLSILGAAALLVAIVGLITGTKITLQILTAIIVVMWIIATIRHIFS